MKDNVLSVNMPSPFFLFFMWSHQSPPATIQPQNGSWNLKRQEALFIKVYASFNQSLHLLLHRETSWTLFCKGVKVIFFCFTWIDFESIMHKSMHCSILTIMRPLHIITWTLLHKHIWKTIMLYAPCKCAFVHAFECQMRDFSTKHRWAQHFYCLSVCGACVCVCDLLSRGIYAKPAVFPYAPSYRCLSSTWPGLAPVLACIVTPGYSNTQSHHHPIPYAEADKRILSFWLLCSCCSLEEVKGRQSTVQIWMDISQAELVHVKIAQHWQCVLYLNYTPTKK